MLLSLSPIRELNGVVTGASEIALDITQRKRSERFLNVERAVTSILTECKNLAQAGPKVLQTIAECLHGKSPCSGWLIGRPMFSAARIAGIPHGQMPVSSRP